jgi:glutamate carboxypeptidase
MLSVMSDASSDPAVTGTDPVNPAEPAAVPPSGMLSALLSGLREAGPRMVAEVAELVGCESPSDDIPATLACVEIVDRLGTAALGRPAERIEVDGRTHLRWRNHGSRRVLLLGHCDTVWPHGTLARWPFSVTGDRATGPGIFDMKAGLVQIFHALSAISALTALSGQPDLSGISVLVTTDEELGSPTSRGLIESEAEGAAAAFVLEASAGAALKTVRKGVSLYRVLAHGRAAHAGLEPEAGVNASVEIAHQVLAINELGDPTMATTVTPTVLRGGRTTNTVPDAAEIAVDVRAASVTEQHRVDDAMRALTPVLPGGRLTVEGGINRPPLDAVSSADLFDLAQRVQAGLGLPALEAVAVGGGSDGNFTAGIGTPTLDGLGAVGDHAHAEGEWASVSALPERAALLAGLILAVRGS